MPNAKLDLYAPSAVPSRYPPSTHVAVIVRSASSSGIDRPATIKSCSVPPRTLRAARLPIKRKTPSITTMTAGPSNGFSLPNRDRKGALTRRGQLLNHLNLRNLNSRPRPFARFAVDPHPVILPEQNLQPFVHIAHADALLKQCR